MSLIDLTILIIYLCALLLIGISVGLKENLEDFLINRRRAKLWLLVFSVVSTNVGAATFVGIAAAAYDTGISYGITVALIVFIGFILTGFLSPLIKRFGDKYQCHTVADFFLHRYSKRNKILVAIIIFSAYFFFMAAQFTGVALILNIWTGIEINLCLLLAAFGMVLYTSFAGIKSDFYTDIIHFWVMFVTIFVILGHIVINNIGGLAEFTLLEKKFFSPFSFGGPGFFFGAIIFGFPLMFVSMEVWQRIYSARNEITAKKAFILSAFFNLPFIIFPIILGLSGKILLPMVENKDLILFELMKSYLPSGILGLAVAGTLSAFISTANSMIMVNSATAVKDFYIGSKFQPSHESEKETLKKARIFTFIIGITGLIVARLFSDIVQLTISGFQVISILAPPILGGIFWKKANEKASFFSILFGFIFTLILLPIIPKLAFIPGFLISLIIFVTVSIRNYSFQKLINNN